jgi:prepilin-type N-terminal cleavage/methylation domain-containing protein
MLKTLRSRKGFSLIELMIVVVIIGILAALAIPRFTKASDLAKEKEAEGLLKQVLTMQEVWKAQDGNYTADLADLREVGYADPAGLQHYADPVVSATCAHMVSNSTATPKAHRDVKVTYLTGEIEHGSTC